MPLQLPEVVGQTFKNTAVAIEGKSFRNCRFENCHIVYRGGEHICVWTTLFLPNAGRSGSAC